MPAHHGKPDGAKGPPSVVNCAGGSGTPEAALPLSEAQLIGSVDALHPVEIRLVRDRVCVESSRDAASMITPAG